jgi:hypothetical protein
MSQSNLLYQLTDALAYFHKRTILIYDGIIYLSFKKLGKVWKKKFFESLYFQSFKLVWHEIIQTLESLSDCIQNNSFSL